MTTSCALYPFCTRDCGCIERPAFPTPSDFQMAKELWQNSRTCGEIAKVCLRSWVVNLIVIASGAKQSIFDVAMPSHGLLRSARNDEHENLAPLAAKGPRRSEAKYRIEGEVSETPRTNARLVRICPVVNTSETIIGEQWANPCRGNAHAIP